MKLKLFICSALLLGGSFSLFASITTKKIQRARLAMSDTIIKCSPYGDNGGFAPAKAISKLKDGMTLFLMPGTYINSIDIVHDKIIVTSAAKGKCNVRLKVSGQDCIIKNINLSGLNSIQDIVIVDSIIGYYSFGTWSSVNNKNVDISLYNTGLGSLYSSGSNRTIVEMKNCVVDGAIHCNSNMTLSIEDSILYSSGLLFNFSNGYNKKQGRITIKDSILFANNALGKVVSPVSSKNKNLPATSMKELKKLWKLIFLGDNIVERPEFVSELHLFQQGVLKGKRKGCIPEEHPFKPIKRTKVVAQPPRRNVPRIINNRVPRRKPIVRTPPPPNTDDFGGLPKPPQ